MTKRFVPIYGLYLAALVLLSQPQQAKAMSISIVECSVAQFVCPNGNIIGAAVNVNDFLQDNDAGLNANLAVGGFTLPLTGTATNTNGIFISLTGTGTATSPAGLAAETWIDVTVTQTYNMNPGIVGLIGAAVDFNQGNCNAAAVAADSSVQATLSVNGTLLPVLGAAGNGLGIGTCATAVPNAGGGGTFNLAGGPVFGIIPGQITLTGLAQFDFKPAAGAQTIDVPYGESDTAPEPGTWLLMGSGGVMLGLVRRKRRA